MTHEGLVIQPVTSDTIIEVDDGYLLGEPRNIHPAGTPVCGAKKHQCRGCDHVYSREEYDLWGCPDCGEDRHCLQIVDEPGARCKYHGGQSLSGIASANFRTGRHSKYLPARLVARYEEALGDERLSSLRDEIALLDARLSDLLRRVDSGEAGRHWAKLEEHWAEFNRAHRRQDTDALEIARDNLEQLIIHGHSDYAAWAEVAGVVDGRRKLVETQRRLLVDAGRMIEIERAMNLFGAFLNIVREHVTDAIVLNAIGDDVRNLLDHAGR